jgi:hypothetical protein
LAGLCKEINDGDAKKYEQQARKVAARMMGIMYDEETAAFYDVYGHENKKSKVLTFTIGVPCNNAGGSPGNGKRNIATPFPEQRRVLR